MGLNENWQERFDRIAPAGYHAALRVGFAFPVHEANTFPKPWVQHYARYGLMMNDPAVKWAYDHRGVIRWSDLLEEDKNAVLASASVFGMNFGAVLSHYEPDVAPERSYVILSHDTREFTNSELDRMYDYLCDCHEQALPPQLTKAELEALNLIKEGFRIKEISHQLGVSDSAIKVRLSSAKRKMGARTVTHAAGLAVSYRMI